MNKNNNDIKELDEKLLNLKRKKELDDLFHTRDLNLTKNILDKYMVDYILITPNMKQNLVW